MRAIIPFLTYCIIFVSPLFLRVAVGQFTVNPETVAKAIRQTDHKHPLLFADHTTFIEIRHQIVTNDLARHASDRILFEADQMLAFEPSTREMEGRRLLAVSRRTLHRVSILAMAYRLTGTPGYLARCAAEMRAVADFTDWNPSHFLDVAEMTLALAVGYDWLFDDLDETTRKTVSAAILDKGLITSMKYTGWVKASNNWGQVCHAGMLAGAFALMDQHEALASEVIYRAITSLPRPMKAYAPNGAYPEGPGYWSYGTDFNVLAICLIESLFKSDFGLTAMPGFKETSEYLDLVTGPSGMTFNYADGGMGRDTDCATWWFAKRFNRPDILPYFETNAFIKYCTDRTPINPRTSSNRLFAFSLFWLQPLTDGCSPKAPLNWSSGGEVPFTIQRTSWKNDRALFVGLKAGSPSAPHGHMDAGSFVLDSDGVRWAYDIGAESYHRIESRKMNLWNTSQHSDRWKIFRLSSLSHNTLTIDGQLQCASGKARVIAFKNGPESEAVLDLSSVYTNASHVVRTGTLLSSGKYRLTDTIKGVKPGTRIRWAMATKAVPDSHRIGKLILRMAGKQLQLDLLNDEDAAWKTYEAEKPQNDWDSPNKGMLLIGFDKIVPASGELTLSVLFSPGSSVAR